MYLQVIGTAGTYTHEIGEAALSVTRDATRDAAGRVNGYIERWGITGQLQGASATALTTSLANLLAAYSAKISSIALYQDDGTVTHHALAAAGSMEGIIVTMLPSFPQGGRDQYVIVRDYTIALEAEYPTTGAPNLIEFSETVTIQGGGGPRIVAIETRNTKPVMQQVSQYTPVYVMQSGQAVGRFVRPAPPPRLFPAYESSPEATYAPTSPRLRGTRYEAWPVSWSYRFILPTFSTAQPNLWPR